MINCNYQPKSLKYIELDGFETKLVYFDKLPGMIKELLVAKLASDWITDPTVFRLEIGNKHFYNISSKSNNMSLKL